MKNPDLRERLSLERLSGHLLDEANRYGRGYLDNLEDREVYPAAADVEGLRVFEEPFPETGSDPMEIISMLGGTGSAATVAQGGGRYFGFVNGGVLPVSQAARLLSDYWDQNAALSVMSPTVGKLEEVTEAWLADLFGLPAETVCGFVSGTSVSLLCGLAAARFRVYRNVGWDINRQGFRDAPAIRIVTGAQAHATVLKATALLGFGTDNIETIDCDSNGRIDADKVPALDSRTILVMQAGNVSSGAFDSFSRICQSARDAGAWIHVDGAFGLWAAASDNLRHLTDGIELADSWSVDAHKTLNVPYDNGLILCRHPECLGGLHRGNQPGRHPRCDRLRWGMRHAVGCWGVTGAR